MDTHYLNEDSMSRSVGKGKHRAVVGGMWDEIGRLQFEFLKSRGLEPQHRLLDVGCGCLRGGVHFVRYLEPGNYYGVDASQALLEAGLSVELPAAGLDGRMNADHLVCTGDFDFSAFDAPFDFALALSVFTHLSFNHVRICLERLAPAMAPGGVFFASYFMVPEDHPTYRPLRHDPGGIVTEGARDPYHFRVGDFRHAATGLPWTVENIGAWGHPRDQRMMAFVRTPRA